MSGLQGNVVLVVRDGRAGLVLERALADRGLGVTRVASGRAFASWEDPDALVLVLNDEDTDDADIFDTLARVSSLAKRPPVVMLTRRADARALDRAVLQSLGIDCLVAWPCRIGQLLDALDLAKALHEPLRLVS